jgi:hypothetical protein
VKAFKCKNNEVYKVNFKCAIDPTISCPYVDPTTATLDMNCDLCTIKKNTL